MYKMLPRIIISLGAAFALISCTGTKVPNHEVPSDNGGITTTPLSKTIAYDAVYVVNGGDNSITVIDAQADSVAGTIQLRGATYPHHVSLSPDRSKISVSVPGMDFSEGHHGGMAGMMGAVAVLDARTGQLVKARKMMSMNHNAIFTPDGNEIWTSGMMDSGMVYALDASTLDIIDSMRAGNAPQEVTFDIGGRHAFVCNGVSGTVSVFERTTRVHIKDITVDSNPVGAWPGENGMMYVDNEDGKSVSAIDTATLSVHHRYNLGFTPGMVAAGPDSSLWIIDSDNGKVIMNMTDSDMKMGEVTTGAGAHGIAFNGDKSKAYITNQHANTVTVINVQAGTVSKTIPVGNKPNGLVWRKN